MPINFDRQKLMQNLQAVMEQRRIKANELEMAVGVYSGYISRLKSEESKLPGLDVIWKMAKQLGVNLERLIDGSFERETDTLKYMQEFLQELYTRTMNGDLSWKPVHVSDINSILRTRHTDLPYVPFILYNGTFPEEFVDNPLNDTPFGGSGIRCDVRRVRSFSLPGEEDLWLNGGCFYTDFDDYRKLYVAKFCGKVSPGEVGAEDIDADTSVGRWIEFVVVDTDNENDVGTLLCSTYYQGTELRYDAQKLFEELEQHEWDYRIEPDVRSMIDQFMRKNEPEKPDVASAGFTAVEADELPF